MSTITPQQAVHNVETFYDATSEVYRVVMAENLHFGYWLNDDDDASVYKAQEQLTDWMIEQAQVGPGSLLLDSGCGMGGPAVRLAQEKGCNVIGITLSQNQVDIATQLAADNGVSELATFQKANMLAMPFEPNTFDAVWAFESLHHVPSRLEALQQILKVLKPGKPLVIADIISTAPMDDAERALMNSAFANYMPIFFDEYAGLLEQAGFEIEQLHDKPDITTKTMIPLGEAIAAKRPDLTAKYGEELAIAVVDGWDSIARLLTDKGGYVLAVARKPA